MAPWLIGEHGHLHMPNCDWRQDPFHMREYQQTAHHLQVSGLFDQSVAQQPAPSLIPEAWLKTVLAVDWTTEYALWSGEPAVYRSTYRELHECCDKVNHDNGLCTPEHSTMLRLYPVHCSHFPSASGHLSPVKRQHCNRCPSATEHPPPVKQQRCSRSLGDHFQILLLAALLARTVAGTAQG